MAADMKAVLTLTADASGVAVGVGRALQQIDRLQQGVAQLRGLAFAGVLSGMFGTFTSGAMDQANQIMDAARSYSPEGMRGALDKQIAETESMMELGKAFGNIVGMIDQAAAGHIRDLTQYLIDNKEPIGQALAAIVGFGFGIADMSAQLLVGFGDLLDWIDRAMMAPGQAAADVGAVIGQGMVGGSAQWTAVTTIYDLLKQKLGGD